MIACTLPPSMHRAGISSTSNNNSSGGSIQLRRRNIYSGVTRRLVKANLTTRAHLRLRALNITTPAASTAAVAPSRVSSEARIEGPKCYSTEVPNHQCYSSVVLLFLLLFFAVFAAITRERRIIERGP